MPLSALNVSAPPKPERSIAVVVRVKWAEHLENSPHLNLEPLDEDQLHDLILQFEHALDALHDGKDSFNGRRA